MELKEIEINPKMAQEMLNYNTCNRPLSKNIVTKYARMMKRDEWYLSHQAIAFAENESGQLVLVDGQHRLEAVIQSGISVKFSVIYNAVQTPYIDTARNRTFIDNLNIYNKTSRYTKTMMGILNLITSINKIKNITQTDRQQFCDYYYEIFLSVDNIYKTSKTKSGGCPLKTALFLAINENRNKTNLKEKLENYMYIFNTGNVSVDDDYGDYVKEMRDHYYLQNREFNKIYSSNSASLRRKKLTSIFLYSIECYINNRKYIASFDMEDRLLKKIEKQYGKIKK
ncbi:hypothetical protein [Anaerocolumna sp.]|uniref:hypothetical protein n=1 Tax=Anaerocolumna sp. TaxID=2041569 RepID=UPI0028A78DDB|nr:hypothetical protein [Anaerocolumna sp.]